MLEEPAGNRVASLMIRDTLPLFCGNREIRLLEAANDAICRILEVAHVYRTLFLACGVERRLIAQVGNISTGETRRECCETL